MKRNMKITCLVLTIVLLMPIFAGSFVMAAGGVTSLELLESDPVDGADGVQTDNVAVKLKFDGDVTNDSVKEINRVKFEFVGGKKETIETTVYFDPEHNDTILVTAQKMDDDKPVSLSPKSEYTLIVREGLTSAEGGELSQDLEIGFTTIDTSGSTKIYMLLMVAMVVGMILMTRISTKRKEKAKAEIAGKIKPANPYKMAKEKGISVDEAMAIIAKEKEKRDKRLKKAGIDVEKIEKETKEKLNTKRVKGPRPISAAGSTYVSPRKALAEKKAKEEAARKAKGTTNPKNKNKKKKKKK